MSRTKKDGCFITVYLDKELNDKLDRVSVETMRTKTAIVELALKEYFKGKKKQD